jgi:hypothetical protein
VLQVWVFNVTHEPLLEDLCLLVRELGFPALSGGAVAACGSSLEALIWVSLYLYHITEIIFLLNILRNYLDLVLLRKKAVSKMFVFFKNSIK